MAKPKTIDSSKHYKHSPKKKRPGIHSKCKNSVSKNSKNYKKAYVGQGK